VREPAPGQTPELDSPQACRGYQNLELIRRSPVSAFACKRLSIGNLQPKGVVFRRLTGVRARTELWAAYRERDPSPVVQTFLKVLWRRVRKQREKEKKRREENKRRNRIQERRRRLTEAVRDPAHTPKETVKGAARIMMARILPVLELIPRVL
jgi:hypothetical protein